MLNEELKRLKKDMNNLKRRGTVNQSAVELPAKRKVQPVDFYGAKQLKSNVQKRSDNTRPKMTEVCMYPVIAACGEVGSQKFKRILSCEMASHDYYCFTVLSALRLWCPFTRI